MERESGNESAAGWIKKEDVDRALASMVDKVAWSISADLARQKIAASWGADFSGVRPALDIHSLARSALAAMKFPTDAMKHAFYEELSGGDSDGEGCWNAMIDAALNT